MAIMLAKGKGACSVALAEKKEGEMEGGRCQCACGLMMVPAQQVEAALPAFSSSNRCCPSTWSSKGRKLQWGFSVATSTKRTIDQG